MPTPEEMGLPGPEEAIRSRILFDLIEHASGVKHWKSAFEFKIMLASKEHDPPIERELVRPFARDIAQAIQFFHGAAVTINLETMEVRPRRGEAAAYVLFDGWTLTIGSTGYQG